MATSDFLFIHPLLGADDAWSGYLVETLPPPRHHATLDRLTMAPTLADFDHRHPWFIPATAPACQTGDLGERAVFVFPADAPVEQAEGLQALEAERRKAHGKVAMLAGNNAPLPAAGAWHYLLLPAGRARSLPPYALIGLSSRTTIVAIDVHSHIDRLWFLDNACTLSTAEFLLTRATKPGKADTTRIKLLELLALIAKDADTAELDAVFRQESKLSYSLLRLVNSAAIAPSRPITSFAQAINLLGRRQLQRWLQLLVYADPNNGQHPNPLLQKAAARGHLLESLVAPGASGAATEELRDAAFMVGSFSLLHVLLNMPMSEIVHQLPLAEAVTMALTEHGGALGRLLGAVEAAEARDLQTAASRLGELGIDVDNHLAAQLGALAWAAKIHPASE
jgi:EAL and modified HD-GYP domain-containing signal transduction protein